MPDRIIPNTAGLQPDAPKTWPRRRTFGELSRVALRSRELIPTGQFHRNNDYGSWRRLPPANPEVMLVASSTSN